MAGVILGTELTIFADIFGLADTNAVGFFVLLGGAVLAYELIPALPVGHRSARREARAEQGDHPAAERHRPGNRGLGSAHRDHRRQSAGRRHAPRARRLRRAVRRVASEDASRQAHARRERRHLRRLPGRHRHQPEPLRRSRPPDRGPLSRRARPRHRSRGSACRGDLRGAVELPPQRSAHVRTGGVDDFFHTGLDDVPTSTPPKQAAAFALPLRTTRRSRHGRRGTSSRSAARIRPGPCPSLRMVNAPRTTTSSPPSSRRATTSTSKTSTSRRTRRSRPAP